MLHKQIRIPKENAPFIMSKLGEIDNAIQFVDLNKEVIETKKPFYKMITRCDEAEKIFSKFDQIIHDFNLECANYKSFDLFITHLLRDIELKDKKYGSDYFDYIENEIIEDERKLNEQIKFKEESIQSYFSLLEESLILDRLSYMFNTGKIKQRDIALEEPILNETHNEDNALNVGPLRYISGICNSVDENRIKRTVFRVSRNRAIPGFFNIQTYDKKGKLYANSKNFKERKMFFIMCQGDYLYNRVQSILKIFDCHMFPVPNENDIKVLQFQTQAELEKKEKVIIEGNNNIKNYLITKISKSEDYVSLYSLYRNFFKREKLIYANLNKCLASTTFFMGEVWIPEEKFPIIQRKIEEILKANEQFLSPQFFDMEGDEDEIIPSYFPSNDFLYPFQELVSTYGIPRYKEANPTLFTIITFPFLFGIMFGDIGHGLLLFLLSAFICIKKQEIENSDSILSMALKYRYLLLLMGFFAFYCGLMYNDFMALPLSFFSSCYDTDPVTKVTTRKPGCVYPMGFDPKWYAAVNDLAFTNSFKMKWSVIVGVIQMTVGIILRGMNNLYFKDYVGFFFEFIPQILFMTFLFGYMIFLIYVKWLSNWDADPSMAPSIISELMGMALKGGSVDGKPTWGTITTEEMANKIFVYIAVICVPLILIVKPVYRIVKNNNKEEEPKNKVFNEAQAPLIQSESILRDEEIIDRNPKKPKEEKHVETAGDIIVHQCIETIEFVLGCVSNTASYLRLWALSLAHGQLSKVFFEKALLGFAQMNSIVLVIIGYFVFAHITVGVLMGMDLMESLLHTLRLHWVEFQNKFYAADGVKFEPFSFRIMIEGE